MCVCGCGCILKLTMKPYTHTHAHTHTHTHEKEINKDTKWTNVHNEFYKSNKGLEIERVGWAEVRKTRALCTTLVTPPLGVE